MGAITLPYPQTPFLGKGALSLCSDFDTQRQAESFFCAIHPGLFFGAQVGLDGWPSGLTRPLDQSVPIRYLLPDMILHFSVADTRVQRISFRPLRLPDLGKQNNGVILLENRETSKI